MRTLDPATEALLDGGRFQPAWLAEIEFESGLLYIWTGNSELNWNGHTWVPVGGNGFVEEITETEEVRASGIRLELSGFKSEYVGLAIGSVRQGKSATVYLAFLNDAGAFIGAPIQSFTGSVDTSEITDDGSSATITLNVESELILLGRKRVRRYTHHDQLMDYPSDLGFKHVAAVAAGQESFAGSTIGSPGGSVDQSRPGGAVVRN